MTSGRLQQVGSGFTLDGVPFEVRGATMFSLWFNWAYGGQQSFVAEMVTAMQQSSIRTPRIFVTVKDNVGWGDGALTGYPVVLDPADHANFYPKFNQFAKMMLAEGFFPEYVIFGSCEDGFATRVIRDGVCRAVGEVLQPYPCLVQISPDPVGTLLGREGANLSAYNPWDEAQRLVTVYKTADINNPVASAGGSLASQINRPLADWMGYTSERLIGSGKWEWITEQILASPVLVNGNTRATINDFPMSAFGNPDPDQNDTDPNHWWAFGLLCQFLQMGGMFHSQELYGSFLTASTLWFQLQAWRAGRLQVARKDYPVFWITDAPSNPVYGDCPWMTTTVNAIFGRHNGQTGMAVAMLTPALWTPTMGLSNLWDAEIIEQRGDSTLVGLMRR